MTKLSKLTKVGSIALMSVLVTAPTLADTAGKHVGPSLGFKALALTAPTSVMTSDPRTVYPNEYLLTKWYGSVNFHKDDDRYYWLNVRDGLQPMDIWNRMTNPSFAHQVPGHNTGYISGSEQLGPIEIRNTGSFSTRFSTVNGSYWNIGSQDLKAYVYRYQGCFEQNVRVNVGSYFSVNMTGSWCVGDAKIQEAQTAVMENPYNIHSLLAFQGTDIQATRWWPSNKQKKRFLTTSFPQFSKSYSLSIPGIDITESIYAPSIKFEYHNNGTYRIRYHNGTVDKYSDWYNVSSDRKTINI